MLVSVVMLQLRRKKNQFWLDNIKESQISVELHRQLFKMISTILYPQFCVSQNVIHCLSENVIMSPYAVSGFQDSQLEFPCLQFLLVDHILHVAPMKQSRDMRSGDLTTTKTNITNLITQLKIGVFLMWYYLTHNFLLT